MTIHISPLLKFAIAEKAEKANFKNVNTYINEVLTKHIKEEQAREKVLTELEELKESVNDIKEVLALLIQK